MAVGFRSAASAAAEAASITISKPTGTVEGDLMIASFTGDGNAGNAPTGPAGWTLGDEGNPGGGDGSNAWTAWWWKIAGPSEPASYDFSQTGSADSAGGIITLTGTHETTPIDTHSEAMATSNTPTASGITTTADDSMLVIVGGQQNGGTAMDWTPPGGVTQRYENATTGSGVGNFGGTEPFLTAGATGSRAFSSNRNDFYAIYLIAVQPPPAAYFIDVGLAWE